MRCTDTYYTQPVNLWKKTDKLHFESSELCSYGLFCSIFFSIRPSVFISPPVQILAWYNMLKMKYLLTFLCDENVLFQGVLYSNSRSGLHKSMDVYKNILYTNSMTGEVFKQLFKDVWLLMHFQKVRKTANPFYPCNFLVILHISETILMQEASVHRQKLCSHGTG